MALVLSVTFLNAGHAATRAEIDTMIEDVLSFWFDYDHNDNNTLFNRALWWQKSDDTDKQIRENFSSLRTQAINGELDNWLETPKGTLAYIILIDQFSRNLLRGQAAMYAHDPLALNAAKMAIEKGYDKSLSLTERVFIYMPFEHSENIEDQKLSVKLFEMLIESTPEPARQVAIDFAGYAKDHHDTVEKFNRFPHRNKILSRESTPEEIEFMKTHKGW